MLNIVLYQPEIPPNTGNIMRLCANTGFRLHLIKPLGFDLDDKKLRRAGMDYREWADVHQHASWDAFAAKYTQQFAQQRIFAVSTKGQTLYTEPVYQADDFLVFGPETRGLPETLLASLATDRVLRLPMQADSRSLNLSNSVAALLYESWRQLGFEGAALEKN
ncbi:MAG: tRNA (uridine(34)/cytosine(34)/5-carboxymethylaminomethyluridine(34)-2'-O)-methyltransferase TrmL [Pseudomonadales bacterium]